MSPEHFPFVWAIVIAAVVFVAVALVAAILNERKSAGMAETAPYLDTEAQKELMARVFVIGDASSRLPQPKNSTVESSLLTTATDTPPPV